MATQKPKWKVSNPKRSVIQWLLDSDPSIRWQVMHDLTDEPEEVVVAERSRIASEGWGVRLPGLQTPGGHWGAAADEGLMTTVYTLVLLKDLGVDPASEDVRRAIGLVRDRITWWQLDGRPYFDGETEPYIKGERLCKRSPHSCGSITKPKRRRTFRSLYLKIQRS